MIILNKILGDLTMESDTSNMHELIINLKIALK